MVLVRLCKQFTHKTRSRRLSGTPEPDSSSADSSSAESSSSSDEEDEVLDVQMRVPTVHEQLQQEQTRQIENATMQEKFTGQPQVSAVPAAPTPSIEPSAPEVPAPPLSPICLSDEESSQKTLGWDSSVRILDHVDGTFEFVVQPNLQMVVALAVAVMPEPPAPASAPEAAPLPAPMVEPPEPLVPVPALKRGLAIDLLDDSDDDPLPKKSRWAFEFVGLLDKMQRTAKRLSSSVADDLQEVVPGLAEEPGLAEPGLAEEQGWAEPGLADAGLAEPVLAEPEPGLAEPGSAPVPELPFEPVVFQRYRKTTAQKGTIRSYVQGAAKDGKWKLIAEIKEKQCADHVKIIEDVLAECRLHCFTQDQARACAAQKLASALANQNVVSP